MHGRNENRVKDQQFFISREAVLMTCGDLLPFSIVESANFRRFWSRTSSNVTLTINFASSLFNQFFLNLEQDADLLPSRDTLSDYALDEVFRCMKNALIEFLQKTPNQACMTMDGWSDRYRHISYFTFTYHCLVDWKVKSLVLSTKAFKGRHFGTTIKTHYEDIIKKFKLESKDVILVTDMVLSI